MAFPYIAELNSTLSPFSYEWNIRYKNDHLFQTSAKKMKKKPVYELGLLQPTRCLYLTVEFGKNSVVKSVETLSSTLIRIRWGPAEKNAACDILGQLHQSSSLVVTGGPKYLTIVPVPIFGLMKS